jgi:hypothetical protein
LQPVALGGVMCLLPVGAEGEKFQGRADLFDPPDLGGSGGVMAEQNPATSLDAVRKQWEEQLRAVDEAALIVLKGHLLIEEMLETIISTFVFHPQFIKDARLTFSKKVSLARSMSLREQDNEMWEIALKLNSLRNELAHSLQSQKRTVKTQAVIDVYFQQAADMPHFDELKGHPEPILLAHAVAFFLGFLSTFLDEVKRFRKLVDELDAAMNPRPPSDKAKPS